MNKLLIGCMAAMVAAGCCDCSKKTARKPVKDVKFVVLDPGHFHAALVLNRSYEGVEKDVRVFAPEGPDVAAHKKLVDAFNSREKDPTSWNEVIYTGGDYLQKALESGDKASSVVVLAGKNDRKADYYLSAIKAGKLTLERIAQLISERASFAFETTLSGRGHLRLLSEAKAAGYQIAIYYLWMPEPAALPLRIGHRVLAGGHDVPTDDVMRRYARSRANVKEYAALADTLLVFDAVPTTQRLIYRRNGEETPIDRKLADAMRKDLGI